MKQRTGLPPTGDAEPAFAPRGARESLLRLLRERGIRDERVLAAIQSVPRHRFVEESLAHRAYDNTALPIGYRQTISQPWIVARMTEAVLAGRPGLARVLEIGTGSGYQSAVLGQVAQRVFSVERIQALSRQARERLSRLRIDNVSIRFGDGAEGWPAKAPFDAIVVTAAPRGVPQALFEQLAEGAALVAPIEIGQGQQRLERYTRMGDTVQREILDAVQFVPMLAGSEMECD